MRTPARSRTQSGQSVVEFALVLPLLLIILLGIADMARIYTTMLTVESAAREAADYGTLYPWQWQGDPTDPASNYSKTVVEMERRACIAAQNLPDYAGSDGSCSNPAFSMSLDTTPAGPGLTVADCPTISRSSTPCNVSVTLTYEFRLIVPLNLRLGDVQLGLPSTLTFDRTSVFAISDFEIDE
jgi:Flp pilus assembly protein TadG